MADCKGTKIRNITLCTEAHWQVLLVVGPAHGENWGWMSREGRLEVPGLGVQCIRASGTRSYQLERKGSLPKNPLYFFLNKRQPISDLKSITGSFLPVWGWE